jgi:uncharacterized protein with GYD domain
MGLQAMPRTNRRFTCSPTSGSSGLRRSPEYFETIHKIVESEGGTVERFLAVMGPWEYVGIFEYPDLETAFRVLGKIAKLELFEIETFPAEDVKVFWKALV